MSYKFLLFDLDHTLLDFDAAEDVALTQLLKEEGVTDIQSYKDYYVPMNKALWRKLVNKSWLTRAFLVYLLILDSIRMVLYLPSVTNFTSPSRDKRFWALMNS